MYLFMSVFVSLSLSLLFFSTNYIFFNNWITFSLTLASHLFPVFSIPHIQEVNKELLTRGGSEVRNSSVDNWNIFTSQKIFLLFFVIPKVEANRAFIKNHLPLLVDSLHYRDMPWTVTRATKIGIFLHQYHSLQQEKNQMFR